jgi:hypothetical protein
MKIVVFDLDETLGYFTEFGIFWDSLVNYLSENNNNIKLTQNDFNNILDLYPEFLRPNIINILNYLKEKKKIMCCHKIMIYTNNNGPREWCKYILNYFDKKINYKLIDHVIAAFKINGKIIEICRTSHNKSHKDLIKCTKIPSNSEICFLDDTFYPDMANENIYYINIKPYYYDLDFNYMIKKFIESNISKNILNDDALFEEKMMKYIKLYKYNYIIKDLNEYDIDKIIGKQIIIHLQEFFNKTKKNKSIKNRTKINKKNKTRKQEEK